MGWSLAAARARDATYAEVTPGHAPDDRRKLLALVDGALERGCRCSAGCGACWLAQQIEEAACGEGAPF